MAHVGNELISEVPVHRVRRRNHRRKDGVLIEDPGCELCQSMTFIWGSQFVGEPVEPFTRRLIEMRSRMAAARDRKLRSCES